MSHYHYHQKKGRELEGPLLTPHWDRTFVFKQLGHTDSINVLNGTSNFHADRILACVTSKPRLVEDLGSLLRVRHREGYDADLGGLSLDDFFCEGWTGLEEVNY